jgi:hypothetical protein
MELITKALAPVAAAATLLALAVAPAAAERASFADPADMGGASLNDIRRVTLDHGADRVVVRVKVVDLRRRSEQGPAGLTIRIDTRAVRPGPEFQLTTGLNAGTDFQLMRVRHGRPVGEPLTCDHAVHLRFAADVAQFGAARSCLGTPARVRIGVKMTDLFDASHPVTDWLGRRGSWTRWLASS